MFLYIICCLYMAGAMFFAFNKQTAIQKLVWYLSFFIAVGTQVCIFLESFSDRFWVNALLFILPFVHLALFIAFEVDDYLKKTDKKKDVGGSRKSSANAPYYNNVKYTDDERGFRAVGPAAAEPSGQPVPAQPYGAAAAPAAGVRTPAPANVYGQPLQPDPGFMGESAVAQPPRIDYRNVTIEGYGECDVEEDAAGNLKITMRKGDSKFYFYGDRKNIKSYRCQGMKEPCNY